MRTAAECGLKFCGHAEDVPPLQAARLGQHCMEHSVSLPLSCLPEGMVEPLSTLPMRVAWRWEHAEDEAMIELGGHGFRGQLRTEVEQGLRLAITRSAEWAVEQHRDGGAVGKGTDFPVDGVQPGTSVHREMGLLVEEGGATSLEALQIATTGSARVLGLQHSLGAVQVGRPAYLLVLDQGPREDLSTLSRPRLVILDGRRHTPRPR